MNSVAAQNVTHERLWTPANIVTLIRICGVPLFVIAIISPWPAWFPAWSEAELWKPWIATGIFILLAATDGLDGYLARSRGEVTNLGKFMDPLADKILVAAALLALIELSVLPSWVALVILCREFIVSGIRMVAASQGVVIAASWYGKAKTVTQIIAIVLFLVKDSHMVGSISAVFNDKLYLISWAVMIVALLLTIISMLDYFVKAKELLGFTRLAVENRSQFAQGFSETNSSESSIQKETTQALDSATAALIEPTALEQLACDVLVYAKQTSKSLGTAESCTGGLIAATLTSIPGSSHSVFGGIVSYSNDVKHSELGVSRETLDLFGAVSEQTAIQMARGARKQLGVDVAVSVTGIAGPDGATFDKPIGTVWISIADTGITFSQLQHFAGSRDQIRLQTVRTALELMRDVLQGNAEAYRVENF